MLVITKSSWHQFVRIWQSFPRPQLAVFRGEVRAAAGSRPQRRYETRWPRQIGSWSRRHRSPSRVVCVARTSCKSMIDLSSKIRAVDGSQLSLEHLFDWRASLAKTSLGSTSSEDWNSSPNGQSKTLSRTGLRAAQESVPTWASCTLCSITTCVWYCDS